MTYISDPFETLLKLAFSEGEFNKELQAEVEQTFNGQYANSIDSVTEAMILNRLQLKIQSETVGQLIKSVMNQFHIDIQSVLSATTIYEETFTSLLEDKILIDSVPVKWIKNLMNFLKVPYDRLESAIRSTHYQLMGNHDLALEGQPCIYRRKSSSRMDIEFAQRATSSGSNDQNQLAMLEQYLNRLKQIY